MSTERKRSGSAGDLMTDLATDRALWRVQDAAAAVVAANDALRVAGEAFDVSPGCETARARMRAMDDLNAAQKELDKASAAFERVASRRGTHPRLRTTLKALRGAA